MLLLVVIPIIFLIVRQWMTQKFLKYSQDIKCGIRSYPLIGHAYLFTGGAVNCMKTFQRFGREAIKNGGMTILCIGVKYFIVAVDAVDLEVILKTSLEKDNVMRFARNFIGNGLIFAPVSIWRPRRKITSPAFKMNNLKSFVKIFAEQSSIMVQKLKLVAANGPKPVWKYVTTYTLDSVCETALGVKLNSQENPEEPLLKSFDIVCKLISERMLLPWLQFDSVYKLLPYHNRFETNKEVLHKFVNNVIKSTRKELKENSEILKYDNDGVMSFLELLIEASGGDNAYSNEELLEEILVMLVAGTDTSAVGISFTISMMAHNPDVQKKVYQELQAVFGDSDRLVDFEDLPHLKYLDAVIRETLRLYPPVPVIVREINEDTKLPSGMIMRKGCSVLIHIWGAHRNPVYWGEDADQFRPERFLEAPLKHPAAFLAFSQGPRSCLGYQYAMMSMKVSLATLLRKYRILRDDENRDSDTVKHEPITVKFDVMMKDVDGFRVRLVERK